MKSSTRGPLNSTLRSSAAASAGKSSSSSSASASKSKSSSSSSASSTRGARAAAAGNNNNNNQSSPNVGSSGRSRAARDRSGGNGDRDRVRDRSGADRASDRGGGGDQDSTAKSARQDGKPKEQLKDLTLDDVNPDFTTWQIPDLARYRRAVKMHHPAPRPIRPPTSPGIAHMRLRLPASAQFLLPNDPDAGDDKSMDVDTTTPTYAKPPPKLVSIQGLDAARALLRPTHQIDLAEYAMRHYYTAAKIPLLDAPPSAESSSLQQQQQQQQPPVMVHPRAEAETILYFVYSSRFNRHRNLQLPMADAALMIREVREGKFATTLSMPASAAAASTSSGATTTSAAALRARQAAAGLSGAGPFSVGPAGPGQVGGTLVLRGAGSESERGQPVHGAAVSRSQPHHQASGSSSRYVHAAHGHHVQQHHHQQVQQQYHPQQQQQVAAARGYGHHPEQHPPQGYQHPHPHHPGHAQQHHQQAARGQHGRA